MTPETLALRELIDARRDEFEALLDKYAATSPKLFGSVARGTALHGSDTNLADMAEDAVERNLQIIGEAANHLSTVETYLPPLVEVSRKHSDGESGSDPDQPRP